MSIHDGHRKRVKNRFLSEGLSSFDDVNILELMLFYSVPRSDTNTIAHRLLDRFGSLHGVFDAPYEKLCETDGISEHTAVLIKLIPQLYSAYATDKIKDVKTISSSDEAGAYFVPRFYGKTNEELYILLLDDRFNIIRCVQAGEGGTNSANADIRRIVSEAVQSNATKVMLAHNHPSGVALPSKDDIKTTEKVKTALALVDIKLLDHIIVSGDDYYSMADNSKIDIFR